MTRQKKIFIITTNAKVQRERKKMGQSCRRCRAENLDEKRIRMARDMNGQTLYLLNGDPFPLDEEQHSAFRAIHSLIGAPPEETMQARLAWIYQRECLRLPYHLDAWSFWEPLAEDNTPENKRKRETIDAWRHQDIPFHRRENPYMLMTTQAALHEHAGLHIHPLLGIRRLLELRGIPPSPAAEMQLDAWEAKCFDAQRKRPLTK